MSAFLDVEPSGLEGGKSLLMKALKHVEPGSQPSYELCKLLLTDHILGRKLTEAPVKQAQSIPREITVQDAPAEVVKAFKKEAKRLRVDQLIRNTMTLKRTYGIASLVVGAKGTDSAKPLDLTEIWDKEIYFNVLDPLNTSGSLVLNQISTAPDFNKPVRVTTSGETFHRSRHCVVMNGEPIWLAWTSSAFGYVGRSVFQSIVYPMKTILHSMRADDMIQAKLGVLVIKKESPASIVDGPMQQVGGWIRGLVNAAKTGMALMMGTTEDVTTLNMQNVDGAGTYSRENTLKNIALGADMPAKMVADEELVSGHADGTEDAKVIVRFLNGLREEMEPLYDFMDPIVQHRAWNPNFYKAIQAKYADYAKVSYEEAFLRWRDSFEAQWPSLLQEPESEKANREKAKFEAVISTVQLVLEKGDPTNCAIALAWLCAVINEAKELFPVELNLNAETFADKIDEDQERAKEAGDDGLGGGEGGEEKPKMARMDSAGHEMRRARVMRALADLAA